MQPQICSQLILVTLDSQKKMVELQDHLFCCLLLLFLYLHAQRCFSPLLFRADKGHQAAATLAGNGYYF